MLRLTGDEAKKVDSSQETIEKWYKFLKKGAENIGFGPNVSENLYTNYDKGLPGINGEIIPLEETGRAIYRRSIADKAMAHWVLKLAGERFRNGDPVIRGITVRTLPDTIRAFLLVYDLLNWSIINDKIGTREIQELLPELSNQEIAYMIEMVKEVQTGRAGTSAYEQLFRKVTAEIYKKDNTKIICFFSHPMTSSCKMSSPFYISRVNDILNNRSGGAVLSREAKELLVEKITTKRKDYLNYNIVELLKTIHTENAIVGTDYVVNSESNKEIVDKEMLFKITNSDVTTSIVDVQFFDNIFDKNFSVEKLYYSYKASGESYYQLVNEEYMIVSLNPIDKLMCSTKQSFGSCLSLAKEGDNSGANGMGATNGLGLFASMPSDAMYLTFFTNGKHKNMYWETAEWMKNPENRNKEKAYKYFKMTMRQLTYKATPFLSEDLSKNSNLNENHYINLVNKLKNNTDHSEQIKKQITDMITLPRLYPGRLYSVIGEDNIFELITAWLMHKAGIRSSFSDCEIYTNLMEEVYTDLDLRHDMPYFYSLTTFGRTTDNKMAWFDKYKKRRGIYFDNLLLDFKVKQDIEADTPIAYKATVQTGPNRYGSHGVTESNTEPTLDSFKFLLGLQTYSFFNKDIKTCKHCGELVDSFDCIRLEDGAYLCRECAEELGYKHCEFCGLWYNEETKHEHETVDLRKYLTKGTDLTEKITCKFKIKAAKIDVEGDPINPNSYYRAAKGYICGNCGTVSFLSYYEYRREEEEKYFYIQEIDGEQYRFRICNTCLNDCVICDCCHEIINTKTSTVPLLIIPGKTRRIVCRDCAENLRIKKEEKENLLNSIDVAQHEINTADFTEVKTKAIKEQLHSEEASAFLDGLSDMINSTRLQGYRYYNNGQSIVKNIRQQITSMTGRKGKGYPKAKDDRQQTMKLIEQDLINFTLDVITEILDKGENND